VFISRTIRFDFISAGLLLNLLCLSVPAEDLRPASFDEIQTLFKLATVGPQRMRVVADITSNSTKWSEEEIATAIKQQNEAFPDMKHLPEATQRERTNAVMRSHSGTQVLHVQEWYSKNYYRLDQTEEGMVSEQYLKEHPGTYKYSFVNIDDPAFSPYRSFRIDYQLHDLQLSKTELYAKDDLWRALGLDKEVILPLLVALADSKSWPQDRPATDADLSALKLDLIREVRLRNGSNSFWHLAVDTENGQENRTRFIMRGKAMSPIEPNERSDMEFIYEVGWVGQRPVCVEASLTNFTTRASFFSSREDFDNQGFPHAWKRTTIKPDSPPKHIDVVFKEVDLNPTFTDEQVFKPAFPTNYIVSDVTSGTATILQNPLNSAKRNQPVKDANSLKRKIILCVFGLVTMGMGIAIFRSKRNRLSE
jgi:hypothetical protein